MGNSTDFVRIRFQNVVQVFYLQQERPQSLREVFARLMLRARGKDFSALGGISFEARSGDILGIIGPNGGGKSTVLKLIAGVYEPTAGRVEVKGSVAPLVELTAGFHPELTGRENIFLNGALVGESQRRIEEQFDRIVAFAELEDFIDAPLRQYSSGMQMRLGFAIVIELERPIVLIDEVLAVGDEAFQHKCIARLEQLPSRGCTVVFVSHDLAVVERVCHRVILLNHGQIVAEGPPRQVIERYYQLVDSFRSPVPSPPAA